MKTNRIFSSAIVLGTGACSLPHALMAQQQPHIILIVSDQHRGDALNCMGNPSVITRIWMHWRKMVPCLLMATPLLPAVHRPVPVCSQACLPGIMACWDMKSRQPVPL
mgnify:CR=1 FL=1